MNRSALAPHPDNPHYFLFRGKPTVLVSSAEHYASVLNLDFDYRTYLDTLHKEGLNHTRLFVGVYRELPNEFWPGNPLGPEPGRYACPFGRSTVAGANDGGKKFDLDSWDEVFFSRLNEFCHMAEQYGIIIEVNLFCPYYLVIGSEKFWDLSPFHPANNINDLGLIDPLELFTLKPWRALAYQEAMVYKIVREVNSHDNLYFEICNEPYFDNVSLAWQEHIAEFIRQEERDLPLQHLISRNVANVWAEVKQPHPAFSIFNFHYPSNDPNCVTTNYHLDKVIGCNETGFVSAEDEPYRIEAWQFMLSGGGLFSHLDVSFRVGDEVGSSLPAGTDKFGGGPTLRRQLRILRAFMDRLDFVHMAPDNSLVADTGGAEAVSVLAELGKQYGIYVLGVLGRTCNSLVLRAPKGEYAVVYMDVCTGALVKAEIATAKKGRLELSLPEFQRDIAIHVTRS
ncbi:MAG: DUF6298 domain-containing protein [Anaerolineae bacterium]